MYGICCFGQCGYSMRWVGVCVPVPNVVGLGPYKHVISHSAFVLPLHFLPATEGSEARGRVKVDTVVSNAFSEAVEAVVERGRR